MSDDRKKPIWPWIVALLIGLPVLYVASLGPACWLADRGMISWSEVYRPLARLAAKHPGPVQDVYCFLGGIAGSHDISKAAKKMLFEEWMSDRIPAEYNPCDPTANYPPWCRSQRVTP
jgi:hypothetical protein